MKKLITITATAILLASCANNEVLNHTQSPENAINFGTMVNKATKATVKVDPFLQNDKFGVFAYYTETADFASTATPNFMYNQAIIKGATSWSYTPLKYWPNNVNSNNERGKVSFFAYWPMENTGVSGTSTEANGITIPANTTTGDPILNFEMSTDVAKQIDLMWGVEGTNGLPYLNQTKPTDATNIMKFTFKHALSRVGFSVKLADDILAHKDNTHGTTTVTINSIEFGGDLAANIEDALVGKLTKKADLNLNNITSNTAQWVNPSDSYYIKIVTDNFTKTGVFSDVATTAAFNENITNKEDSYFMIIPQDFSTNKTKMRITYTVETTDAAVTDGKVAIVNKHVIDLDQNFKSGTAYTYNFTIGLTSVKVEADITAWEKASVENPVN